VLKEKVAAAEKQSTKSVSTNKKALEFYSLGLKETKGKIFKKAEYFERRYRKIQNLPLLGII
jgi:hypothetical protein